MQNIKINSLELRRRSVYILVLGISTLLFVGCSSNQAIRLKNKSIKEWESYQLKEIKKSPDDEMEKWTIYSRRIQGTNFLEYRIEGEVMASAEDCLQAFKQDILNQSTDSNNTKFPTYDIVHKTKDSLLTYVIHNEPFPLKDTEMSVRYIFSNDASGNTGVEWHEAWEETKIKVSKKLSRVESFRGSWVFSPISKQSCLAANSVKFDPKGMPMWMIKPMVFKFLIEGLKTIREESVKGI